jgi:hypothetical protein
MAATGNGSREVRYMEQTIGAQYAAMTAVPQATVRNVRICDAEDVSIRRTGATTAVDDPSQFHPSASWLADAQKCVEDAEAHLQKTHHVAKDDAATGGHKDHTLPGLPPRATMQAGCARACAMMRIEHIIYTMRVAACVVMRRRARMHCGSRPRLSVAGWVWLAMLSMAQ